MVVDAGPTGLETARRLAAQGHRVDLVEREPRIGGLFQRAAGMHAFPEYRRILDRYERELAELPVVLRTGVAADDRTIDESGADAVVVATSGRAHVPQVEGAGPPRVFALRDWPRREEETPERCVVWGADREGPAVADHLAARGAEVLVVDTQSAPDIGRQAMMLPIERLDRNPLARILLRSEIRASRRDRILVTDPPGPRGFRSRAPSCPHTESDPDHGRRHTVRSVSTWPASPAAPRRPCGRRSPMPRRS